MTVLTDDGLYYLYNKLNKKYFNGSLSKEVKIIWSNRLTSSAGNCNKIRKLIKLSTHYHSKYPEDIENTLLHEMIHLKIDNHGHEFKQEMKRIKSIGGEVTRYSKERATKGHYRWKYTCIKCAQNYFRNKKRSNKYVCGKCRGKLIEEYINLS